MKIIISVFFVCIFISCENKTKFIEQKKSQQDTVDLISASDLDLGGHTNVATYSKIIDDPNISKGIAKDYLIHIADSIEIPFFEIEFQLSELAEKKLKIDDESIIVTVTFSFIMLDEDEIPEKFKKRYGFDTLVLLSLRKELIDTKVVRFEGIKLPNDIYEDLHKVIANHDMWLDIQVSSGRRSTENNILHCEIYQGYMSNIIEKRIILKGTLIEEMFKYRK